MTTEQVFARTGGWVTLPLALFGFAVAGYHPYSEDGGVYIAGVKKLLNPALYPSVYPSWTAFVTEHLRFSLFAPAVAGLTRATHIPLEWVLFLLCFGCLWATLYAGWMVAKRCTGRTPGRTGAVSLLACWLTLPIAGTSLMLLDPYLTARSLSTPLVLMALAWTLDLSAPDGKPRWATASLVCAALLAAALVHPLMAAYGLAAVCLVLCLQSRTLRLRRWGPWGLAFAAMAVAGIVQATAPTESANYLRVAITRYYWFLSQWQWFEWLGLLGPVAVLAALLRWRHRSPRIPANILGRSAILLGAIAFAIACTFARETTATHLVARLQPLRCFQIVYEIMILLLGCWLGEAALGSKAWRWAILLITMGGATFAVQRNIYANSSHLEWPTATPRNAWQRAFVWVRQNTPQDARFALDARYITRGHGEDAQCFRALAERSALPDYSKDGGEASITPSLTEPWVRGVEAQTNLEHESDAERAAHLKPFGVNWVVLERQSTTAWPCPYANESVKVCRLP